MSDPRAAAARPLRRAALVFLSDEVLAMMLRLPDGWHIEAIKEDFERNGVTLRVTGPGAPEVTAGMHPPSLPAPAWEYESPSEQELEANPNVAGRLRVILPQWPTG